MEALGGAGWLVGSAGSGCFHSGCIGQGGTVRSADERAGKSAGCCQLWLPWVLLRGKGHPAARDGAVMHGCECRRQVLWLLRKNLMRELKLQLLLLLLLLPVACLLVFGTLKSAQLPQL